MQPSANTHQLKQPHSFTWYVVCARDGPVQRPLVMPPHIQKQQPLLLLLLLHSRRTLCCCRIPSRRKQLVAAVGACVAWTASSPLLLLLLLAGVEEQALRYTHSIHSIYFVASACACGQG
jgi:hypothetical protein